MAMQLTLTARDTDTAGLDLETQTALVFPQRSCHSGLHSWGSNLSGGVKALEALGCYTRQRKDVLAHLASRLRTLGRGQTIGVAILGVLGLRGVLGHMSRL